MAEKQDIRITITHVNPRVKSELENIADNTGISLGALLKPKLREIAESYPPHMKQPPKKD